MRAACLRMVCLSKDASSWTHSGPGASGRMAKKGLNRTEFMPLREGYAYECELTAELRNDPASAQQSKEFIAGGIKR